MKVGHTRKSPLLVLLGVFLTLQASFSLGAPSGEENGEEKGYLAEMMAYKILAEAAGQIAEEIGLGPKQSEKPTIVVTRELDLENLERKQMLWERTYSGLRWFEKTLCDLANELTKQERKRQDGVQPRSSTITKVVDQIPKISKVLEFFQPDVVTVYREVELDERVLVAELANKLLNQEWNVVVHGLNSRGSSQLLALVRDLDTKHLEVTKKVQSMVDDKGWNPVLESVDAVSRAYVEYRRAITEPREGKLSVVEILGFVETVNREKAHRVHVQIVSQGAEYREKKWQWASGRISYLGGVVCLYFWFDGSNDLMASGSVRRAGRISDRAAINAWRQDQTEPQKQPSP